MNIRLLTGLLSMLLALALPHVALADDPVRTVKPGPDAAQLSGAPGLPNQDIFEVSFIEINGNNIQPREVLWLEPGTYTIRVAIKAAHTRPPQRQIVRREDPSSYTIELELEAGKTYQVRGRYNRDNPEPPYSVILYKVDES